MSLSFLRRRLPVRLPTARALYSTASRLPPSAQDSILRESALPNPDPAPDSPTALLVADHERFMVATYSRPLPVFTHGTGSHLYDLDHRRYIDFTSGIAVTSLGHADPRIAELLYEQAKQAVHTSNLYHNPWTGALCQLLIETTVASGAFAAAERAFICNSGTEANEAALKFARKVGKTFGGESKTGLVSFHGSFHGRTMGSLSATPNPKYQKPFSPLVPGFRYGVFNDVAGIGELVDETTCGVIVEPVQGEGGVHVATPEFLLALAQRCREVGAVLIYDEVQCGLGRTGRLWAHQGLAEPDVLTTAKALGNGYPVAATLVNGFVADRIVTGDHGTTFGGNPLACRVACHVFARLAEPALHLHVREMEAVFREGLERVRVRYDGMVVEVRGRGLLLGVQMMVDPVGLVKECRERGLLVITAGGNTVRFVPPLVVEREVVEEGLAVFEQAMEAWVGGL